MYSIEIKSAALEMIYERQNNLNLNKKVELNITEIKVLPLRKGCDGCFNY